MSRNHKHIGWWLAIAASLAIGSWGVARSPSWCHAEDASPPIDDKPAPVGAPGAEAPAPVLPPTMILAPQELRNIVTSGEITRIAIGNPDVLDATLVSSTELLLQAKGVGTTDLIVWDQAGQHVSRVEVMDRRPEAIETQLRQLLEAFGMSDLQVRREKDKIFLNGQVASQEDLDRIEQMLSAYKGSVTNLVTVAPTPPPPPVPPPQTVQLTVQLIEIDRDSTEQFGVDWSDSVTFTETTFGVLGPENVSQVARLGEAFRLGALSRTGFSGVLDMLVTQGKARILSEPKLVAASGKEAATVLGVEVPVITVTSISSGTVSQNIEFKQTGVELSFRPTVLEDENRSIQLSINVKVSSIDETVGITVSGVLVPGFKVRQTQTEVVTGSGESVFIAGLLQDEERHNLSQLPGLGNIPVLGNLFKSTEFNRGKTELVVIVTPELAAETGTKADRTSAVEQALATMEVSESVNDPRLRYALQVQDRIAKSIQYPSHERDAGMGGRVKLRLHLFRDGSLGRAMVSEPSGIAVFDSEALKAAETQAPYPPFPSDLPQQDLWLDLPVLFRP